MVRLFYMFKIEGKIMHLYKKFKISIHKKLQITSIKYNFNTKLYKTHVLKQVFQENNSSSVRIEIGY